MERLAHEWQEAFSATWMYDIEAKEAYDAALQELKDEHLKKVQQYMRTFLELIDPERLIELHR